MRRLRSKILSKAPLAGSARRALLRLRKTNFSQGAEWKALISKYITVISPSGSPSRIGMQSMSGRPPEEPVHSAMSAKVGVAARPSQTAGPEAVWPPPA
jgi:hypothetical protein